MRQRFDQDYIREEFTAIGDALEASVEVFLIGGGSMAFRGLKDATKDIDVVVESGDDLTWLTSALLDAGYEEVREPGEEYVELGAQTILENTDECRFDIFNQQVVDTLIFSTGMKERSEPLVTTGNLSVKMASPEDIFLFKSVTPRADDREDMNILVQTGLDFDTIIDEIQTQTELLGEEFFVTHINQALIELEDRFGVTTPLTEPVEQLTVDVYDYINILNSFEDTTTQEELQQAVELPDDRIDEILGELEEKGNIERDDGRIRKVDDRP